MSEQSVHEKTHKHVHGDYCGHTAIEHKNHVDYVHDRHLHHKNENGSDWDDCRIEESITHPDICTDEYEEGCWAHEAGVTCSPSCGHEAVPHGEHVDYLVPDRKGNLELHAVHNGHCDHHGSVRQRVLLPVPRPF